MKKNIKQSILVAISALVSISIAHAKDADAVAPHSIAAGGCMRQALQAQPVPQKALIKKAPVNEPIIATEPTATTPDAQPMSPELPIMQAPIDPAAQPVIEDTALLTLPEAPAEQAALNVETTPSDILTESTAQVENPAGIEDKSVIAQ